MLSIVQAGDGVFVLSHKHSCVSTIPSFFSRLLSSHFAASSLSFSVLSINTNDHERYTIPQQARGTKFRIQT